MDTTNLLAKFDPDRGQDEGRRPPTRRLRAASGVITLDIRDDRRGEYFEVVSPRGVDPEVAVLDVRPADRHLLLMVREGGEKPKADSRK